MRKILFFLVSLFSSLAFAQQMPVPPVLEARPWLLIEYPSRQVLAANAPDERIEPASLTKLMTAYLVFAALRSGTIKLNQEVLVSERAWRAPGSRMFIQVNTRVKVGDLIKGAIVQSGNDACIALAELIGGSEENFVQMMNREAARMGMNATNFRNSTGLPDPEHYTTAHDLGILATNLIRDFPQEYATYYSTREFRYNNISQPNRNRLLWLDPSVDGMKTGFTRAAGFCLISSAKRGDRRLLSIVLGADSDRARMNESLKLLNFGFQSFDAVRLYAKNQEISHLRVWKGKRSTVKAGFAEDFVLSIPKGQAQRIRAQLASEQPLIAPVTAGQVIGTLKVSLDDEPFGNFPVVALDAVPAAGIFKRSIDTVRLQFN